MTTPLIVEPCLARTSIHFDFDAIHRQNSLMIKKLMLESLEYVKTNQTKERGILDLRIKTFFEAIFQASKLGLQFTKEERAEIGPLINETILDIDDCLLGIGEGFDIDKAPEALIVRSGYQFMVENFKDFPDGNQGTLEHAFESFKESIDILDESLARWKEDPFGCEENVQHSSEALNRPKEVPESHHWWFSAEPGVNTSGKPKKIILSRYTGLSPFNNKSVYIC